MRSYKISLKMLHAPIEFRRFFDDNQSNRTNDAIKHLTKKDDPMKTSITSNTVETVSSIGFIFAPIVMVLMLLSFNAKADSNADLNACIKKTYQAALQAPSNTKPNDLVKFVNKDIKACKDQVKSLVKAEKAAKKRSKLEAQLKKLQSKLSTL